MGKNNIKQHIFIIGSKGIPAQYGGFETFVDKLVEYQKSKEIKYHVACIGKENKEFYYNDAHCFEISVPDIGSGKAVLYDIKSLSIVSEYMIEQKIRNAIIYILACRIGPFINYYKRKIEKINASIFVNPDGHEWKRKKWNFFIRKYWKMSEKQMIRYSDLVICDSMKIEQYINMKYSRYDPQTTYISYGSEFLINDDKTVNNSYSEWINNFNIKIDNYFLMVGRFVPENNYDIVIKEFLKAKTTKDLVIISNITNNKYWKILLKTIENNESERIKFVGTVYDKELLKEIRKHAFAYIHGHEVGGTNPSLLEALGSTNLNLLLNVGFNREVAKDTAIYWSKNKGNLMRLIQEIEILPKKDIEAFGKSAKERISKKYNWLHIINKYENLFLDWNKNENIYK